MLNRVKGGIDDIMKIDFVSGARVENGDRIDVDEVAGVLKYKHITARTFGQRPLKTIRNLYLRRPVPLWGTSLRDLPQTLTQVADQVCG